MLGNISKKINKDARALLFSFKAYLPHIVFLVFTFQFLSYLNTLPYFNIINKYYYYVAAILWILANLLFKEYITNKRILIVGVSMFIFAIPAVFAELDVASDVLGFVAYIFIFTYVTRQIFVDRRQLDIESVK